jgi:hypothetical protein
VYFIALYMQRVLDLSALPAGLALVSATATVMITSTFLARRLLAHASRNGDAVLVTPRIQLSRILLGGWCPGHVDRSCERGGWRVVPARLSVRELVLR